VEIELLGDGCPLSGFSDGLVFYWFPGWCGLRFCLIDGAFRQPRMSNRFMILVADGFEVFECDLTLCYGIFVSCSFFF
jgi:hypothetical protein